eukprot:GHVT01087284.1.p1 GENE.GHVT01087284.1~~GHVT01087284.1.p1  ORF type:complete len:189 (-),score=32.29 GHVT01087284.1:1501-2067(-)
MQKSLTELTLSTFGVGLISSALMLRGMWRASGSPGVDGDGTPLPPVDDSTLGLPATAWLGVVSGSLVVGLSSMLAKRQLARRAHRRERDVSVQAAFDGTAQYYAGAPPPGTTGSLATGRENLQGQRRNRNHSPRTTSCAISQPAPKNYTRSRLKTKFDLNTSQPLAQSLAPHPSRHLRSHNNTLTHSP